MVFDRGSRCTLEVPIVMLPNGNITLTCSMRVRGIHRDRVTVESSSLASGRPEEQEETQTRKLIVFAVGQTLI